MLQIPSRPSVGDVSVSIESNFDFGSQEYREFYSPDRGTGFQAPLWLSMIHSQLAPCLGAVQRTVTIRDETSGALVAVLPLVKQRALGLTILQPADFGVCDYNSIVGDRGTLGRLAPDERVRRALRHLLVEADIIAFRKVREDDFDVSRFLGRAQSSPGDNAAYTCPTGSDFEHFRLKVLRRKFTKELGRLQRQTERDFGSYQHRLLTRPAEIEAAFDFLREREAERNRNGLLLRKPYFDFYRNYALAGSTTGEALTYASYVGDQLAAVLFGMAGDGDMHCVLIQSDTDSFERISPGIQLIYRVVEMRMAEGHTQLDLGLGDPGYKQHFRVMETPVHNHTCALTPMGAAVGLVYHHAKPLKNLLRNMAQHVR